MTSWKGGDGISWIGAICTKKRRKPLTTYSCFVARLRLLSTLIYSLFSVEWVMHSSIRRTLLGWHGFFVGKKRENAWRVALLCLMWTLWKERNERVFNDIKRSNQAIKSFFMYTFVNLVRVYIEDHTLSMIDFIDWLFVK